ncbi:hypothetical protein [Fusobacterium vincentii]|uniref:hypothetical protein n=1 Tax=Fusobacterium vincentii TaxID=155615 RepID=UPI0030CDE9E5
MAKWIEDPQGRLEVEKVTEEIKLPVWKANYKGKFREFWNECWEKIEDSFLKLKKSNEGKEPAIEDKQTAFNKAFGTVEDTVLEGNKFTQMTGKDYGGILNIAGQKEAGKAYWDNNTKKLYICKNNNSDISPNVNNYIPFDSNSLLERLENLFTFETFRDWNLGNGITSSYAKLYKIGELKILYITFGTSIVLNNINFKFPITFREGPYVSYTDNSQGSELGERFGIDWATTTYVKLTNIQSATMLVVGI